MTTEALGATAAGAIGQRGKLANLALLIASFGAGQGTIFLIQTWLVATGRVELLAAFGTVFSFAILCVLLIDFGAATVLARETATERAAPSAREGIWRCYWAATVVRGSLGVASVAAALVYAVTFAGPFERWYLLCALPVGLIWPFNAAGVLDGLRSSGVGGVVAAAPYLLSAAMLLLVADATPEEAGAALGAALSAGYLAAVAGQFAVLRRGAMRPALVRPATGDVARFATRGGGALLIMLPGQMFFRFQLLIASALLGVEATALFLYAKQVVAGGTQIVAMARRIELPELAARFADGAVLKAREVLGGQRMGVVSALTVSALAAVAGAFALLLPGDGLRDAGWLVLAFSPLIAGTGCALMLTQGLVARGQYDVAWKNSATAIAVGTAASAPMAAVSGLVGLGLAELISSGLIVARAVRALRRQVPGDGQ